MSLDATVPKEFIIDMVLKIFESHQSKPEIQIEPGPNVGEGFLGITATISVKLGSEVKHLFLKMAAHNEKLREVMLQKQIFSREVYFYSEIVPLLAELYRKFTKKRFHVTPECVYTSDEDLKESIVLGNLVINNYTLLKSNGYLDKDHLLMMLKTYSHLHACGFILKKENPIYFSKLLESSKTSYYIQFVTIFGFDNVVNLDLIALKQHCLQNNDTQILENLEIIKSKIFCSLKQLEETEEYPTIIHVDCWRNNAMFKYTDNGSELEDMKLIDFQMWTINSPVFDLVHIIYSNAASEEVLDNLDDYLNYYYSSLSKFVVEMGGNPEQIYPRSALSQQWKKHAYYGLFYGMLITRALLGGASCVPNMVEYIHTNRPLNQAFMFDLPNEEEYCKRIKILVKHFIRNKFI